MPHSSTQLHADHQCEHSLTMKFLILSACLALVAGDVSHVLRQNNDDRSAQILKQELDQQPDGTYFWEIETDNGIGAHEHGDLKQVGEDTILFAHGMSQYTSPEGEVVQLAYTADEKGYQPTGSHIPTPPPIPEYILRGLEYIRSHPPAPEPQQRN